MTTKRWAAVGLLCAWVLAGCTSAVTLRHPDGRSVRCGPYNAFGVHTISAAHRESQCISDYQRQGFERAPE